MKTVRIITLAAFLAVFSAVAGHAQQTFARYQVILDRMPFGKEPPPAPRPVPPPIPISQSFASKLRLCSIVEVDGGGIQVGLIYNEPPKYTNKSFYLAVGEQEYGIELVSADYTEEEAVLRKGSEMVIITLASGEITRLTPDQQEKAKTRATHPRANRISRRGRRNATRQPPRKRPEPIYSGEELRQHLQDYNMEVIRQGMPPLPIPLTPGQDAQLVQEGVLPALE